MRRGLICLLLAVWPSVTFAAEPLTMLLIHILRQQVLNTVQGAIEEAQRERERIVPVCGSTVQSTCWPKFPRVATQTSVAAR